MNKKSKFLVFNFKNFRLSQVNFTLIFITLTLVAFGIVMVYSASCYTAQIQYSNDKFFMFKQITGAVLGLCLLVLMSFVDYHKLEKIKWIILCVSIILLGLVFVPGIGFSNYGATRWIKLPFFTIQPSEIAKFAFVIWSSSYLSKNYDFIKSFLGLLPVIAVGGIYCLLIILEPNMSITICMALTMIVMLFVGGIKAKHFAILGSAGVVAIPALIIAEPYRLNRLVAFLNPWQNPKDEGYQLIQSLYALGAGGLFGCGLFNSRQKYMFLPFAESDFIFSIIGEELGLFGCLIVLLMFVILIYQGIKIAMHACDRFGAYLATGIVAVIASQVLINIAVVTGSIPPTGVPLPFISSGGTALVVFMGAIGILINIARQSKMQFQNFGIKQTELS